MITRALNPCSWWSPAGAGSATLEGNFTNDLGATTTAVSTTILPNTWYDATLTFDNISTVGGDVAGTASLFLDGSLVASGAATKGTYGDGLNRPIGIGEFGYGHTTSIIGLHGDIYDRLREACARTLDARPGGAGRFGPATHSSPESLMTADFMKLEGRQQWRPFAFWILQGISESK